MTPTVLEDQYCRGTGVLVGGDEARDEIRRNGGVFAMENMNVGGRIKNVSWEAPRKNKKGLR